MHGPTIPVLQSTIFEPVKLKTTEEAISTIKLNLPNFVQWDGEEVIELNADKFGMIIKAQWETRSTRYVTRPVTTSGYANKKYYTNTTYVGEYQTTTDSGSNTYSLQFKKIISINLRYYGSLNKANKWNMSFWYPVSNETYSCLDLRARDRETAVDIINAVYTLAINSGAKIGKSEFITAAQITPQQARTLGKPDLQGVVIEYVYLDGPAQNSGLLPGDVVTMINGSQVTTVDEFTKVFNKSGLKKIILTVIRKKDFNQRNNIFNKDEMEIAIQL